MRILPKLESAVRRLAPALGAVAAFLVLPASGVFPAPAPDPSEEVERSPPEESKLHDTMLAMKAALKATADALHARSSEDALEHLAELESLVLVAKLLEPPTLSRVPADERASHLVAFRRGLVEVLDVLCRMELDVLDGNLDAAMQKIVDPLFPLREAAHEQFQADD